MAKYKFLTVLIFGIGCACERTPKCDAGMYVPSNIIIDKLVSNLKNDVPNSKVVNTMFYPCDRDEKDKVGKGSIQNCLSGFVDYKETQNSNNYERVSIQTNHYLIDRCGNTLFSPYD